MDTRLKNNKRLYATNIVAFVILITISIGIFSLYPLIKENIKAKYHSPYENYELLTKINQTSYVLYKDILDKQSSDGLSYNEIYIKSYDKLEDYNQFNISFNNELEDWNENLDIRLKNLDYSAWVTGISENKTNTADKLNTIIENTENQDLNEEYNFYMVVHYDENGRVEISNVHGANEYQVRNGFSDFNFKRLFDNTIIEKDDIKFNPIKNATFVYAIPKELKYEDNISIIVKQAQNEVNTDILITIVMAILCSILILGLMVPYRKGKEIFGIKTFLKIPFEINCIIIILGAMFSGIGSFYVVYSTLEGSVGDVWIRFGINPELNIWLTNIINITIWIIAMYLIFVGDMLLKYIFNTGLVKYIKENLLLIKIVKSFKKWSNNLVDYVEHIDLTDKSNKVIIKILAINFLILTVISIIWFIGIGAAIIYTVVLFILLRKYVDNIRKKFGVLLIATNRIADGNLDVEIDEDLGLFNPFKEQIKIIQKGFKKAVNEEVKSQRMKTELISNVSHDLKTPLTSIITYIDLLKNDNATEDERKSYIDTIDKKSQRLKFLIEDLFEVSRANSGDIKLNLVNIDIVELMRQTLIELDDKIKNSNLDLRNNFTENKITLELDSQKTFRIFENLLINVVKYAMEGSRVYIDIINGETNVEVTIKNMSAEEITFAPFDIVERFERGDKSRNTEGSGLGLAIAKSFVEVQNGTFNIEVDGDLFKAIITFKK